MARGQPAPWHPVFGHRLPMKHNQPWVYQQRPALPGVEILSSRHFPEENQGNLLVPNVIGFRAFCNTSLTRQPAGRHEVEPIVSSTDPNLAPLTQGRPRQHLLTDWL